MRVVNQYNEIFIYNEDEEEIKRIFFESKMQLENFTLQLYKEVFKDHMIASREDLSTMVDAMRQIFAIYQQTIRVRDGQLSQLRRDRDTIDEVISKYQDLLEGHSNDN